MPSRDRIQRMLAGAAAVLLVMWAPRAEARSFVEVAGGAFTVSIDASGRFAYLANDTIVAVLDVPARRLVRKFSKTRTRRSIPRSRGFAGAVAITPDARIILVGTTRGVQYTRVAPR